MSSQIELAWATGFFEGEGCIYHKTQYTRVGSLHLSLCQARESAHLLRFAAACNIPANKVYKKKTKDVYELSVAGKLAAATMEQLRPYFTPGNVKLQKYDHIWHTLGAKNTAYNV